MQIQFKNCVDKFNKVILKELTENEIKCWIAGGSVRDYFMGIPVKTDIDIFFPYEENYKKAAKYFKDKDAEIKWESNNGMKVLYNNKTFDLVKKFFKSPKDTIHNFDFTVSMFAVDKDEVYFGDMSFIDLSKRQLMINKITYPESTTSRMNRYIKKGFYICNGELYKIIESIGQKYIEEHENNKNRIENIEEVKQEVKDTSNNLTSFDLASIFFGMD